MPIAVGLVAVILAFVALRLFLRADPRLLAKVIKWVGGVALAVLAVGLILRGRIDIGTLLALGAGALFGVGRFGAIFSALFGGGLWGRGLGRGLGRGWSRARTGNEAQDAASAGSGNVSEITTEWLHLQLDHDSGDLNGEILKGAFRGRRLAALDEADLLRLWREVAHDAQSARLLEAYLDRRLGADWRAEAAAAGAAGPPPATAPGSMTREQALEILGLDATADAATIREAHRRLMKRMHPDHGGSNFLAAQINRAKDVLLGD